MFFIHLMSRDSANWGGKKKQKEKMREEKTLFYNCCYFRKKLLLHSIFAYLKFLFQVIKNARCTLNISIKEFHESMQSARDSFINMNFIKLKIMYIANNLFVSVYLKCLCIFI